MAPAPKRPRRNVMGERVSVLEGQVSALEAENVVLKTQVAELHALVRETAARLSALE